MTFSNDSASPRRLRRLYSAQDLSSAQSITLSPEESRHALRSLRLQAGDLCLLVNGDGWEAEARLDKDDESGAHFSILKATQTSRGFSIPVFVAPALIKKGKMDTLIEKAQEFGASFFQPMICERSEFEIDAARFESVQARWDKIAQEAAKQSGASRVIKILKPVSFAKIQSVFESDSLVLVFHTHQPAEDWVLAARQIFETGTVFSKVIVLTGPEGGFSAREIQGLLDLKHPNLKIISMGNTVLKADTALIAALAGVSFFLKGQ